MEGTQRDSTEEWLLPEGRRPLSVAELEQRVDQALAVARSAESAALEIGAAALESAEQAKRAADLAESASVVALEASRGVAGGRSDGALSAGASRRPGRGASPEPATHAGPAPDPLTAFVERADRVAARFRAVGG
ncbi:MAG: hypothetical protein R2725_16410 [Solirubrobacterales bacterium]